MKKISVLILTLVLSFNSFAQDVRTLDTKVADLLARMPVYSQKELKQQMDQMTLLEEEGWNMICNLLVAPGSGDDIRVRFLIESYSRFLSAKSEGQGAWEKHCIKNIKEEEDVSIKRFLLHQLELVGGKPASDFALTLINDKDLGHSAVRVVAVIHEQSNEIKLAEALKNPGLVTAASVLNTLADWKYKGAGLLYISWFKSNDQDIKRAALNAMAASADPDVFKTLAKAAKGSSYSWESTTATALYLEYANNVADEGNIKLMEKICNEVLKKTDYTSGSQYKAAALSTIVKYKGEEAFEMLAEYFADQDIKIRLHALGLARGLEGESVTKKLLTSLGEIDAEYKTDLIEMIGRRGDKIAIDDIQSLLNNSDSKIRMAAVKAICDLKAKEAIHDLIQYIQSYTELAELENAFTMLATITDSEGRGLLAEAYPSSPGLTKAFMLVLIAEGGEDKYFDMMIGECESQDDLVRNAAYMSLRKVSAEKDIHALIGLIKRTEDKQEISLVQQALANAANCVEDPSERADLILKALEDEDQQLKLIPVLSRVGGVKALSRVLVIFNNANNSLAEVCFDALSGWLDYSASYALYDICASKSKNYQRPAFEGYVRQISIAPVNPEQKLLLLRKIMSLAESDEQRMAVLKNIADVHTLPALMFASSYMDADERLQQLSARIAMDIALPPNNLKTGLYGDNVKIILEKVLGIISGEESDYYKERLKKYIEEMPNDPGFVPMFNGLNLSGWQGLVENPISRAKMSKEELAKKQLIADMKMTDNWSVSDGAIWFSGKGANLCSVKDYADFEMLVDWRITKEGDSGLYLRGTPQVQIWDTSRVEVGAQVGSGGLYNNSKNESDPIQVSDNPVGDWNTFRIIMIGERVSVWLNGEIVVDDVIMENYWDRSIPIFPSGAIELQAHGNELAFRDIFVREIDSKEYMLTQEEKNKGFEALFNGSNLDNWIGGDRGSYIVKDGVIVVQPNEGSGGNLYTENEYSDFNFRFDFKLTPGANNGLGIRTPTTGDAAYIGMEFQILDNTADIYANLQPYQYHGSVYGVIPAKRGMLRPLGEWNSEEVIVVGSHIKIILNGEVIVDADIADARKNGTMDHREHPGLKNNKGHIGFLGHGSVVYFKNIRIVELNK